VSEGTAISPQGQGYADVPGLYDSAQLDGWQQVTKAVHAAGGRIFCQLWHVGRVSHPLLQPGHQPPVAPSAIRANTKTYVIDGEGQGGFTPTSEPRALHRHEIPLLVHDFAAAARNAVQSAGFDGVEIHGANGYLLDQFLKTGANRREDDYGGAIANRARLMLEVARAVADAVGAERGPARVARHARQRHRRRRPAAAVPAPDARAGPAAAGLRPRHRGRHRRRARSKAAPSTTPP
jgi:N-ethylmaleimide reductase